MNLVLMPYVKTKEGWSIPDRVMNAVWSSMVENGRVEPTFYDGNVSTREQFFDYFQNGRNHASLVVDSDDATFLLLAWLNNVDDGSAFGHFTFLDKFSIDASKHLMSYWASLPLNVIIGITPESYHVLIKWVQRMGFTVIGTIPSMCNMAYQGHREGATISYFFIGDNHGRGKI